MADLEEDEDERDQLLNPWIPQGDGEDDIPDVEQADSRARTPIVGVNSDVPLLLQQAPKRQEFMGGIDDDDERMIQFLKDLQLDIEIVKRETLIREASLPVIDEPYTDTERSVAECKFHRLGVKEAEEYYRREIEPFVDTREKIWFAYKAEIVDPKTHQVQAWFIGATNYLRDDIVGILVKMINGKNPRRINEGEKTPEFNRYTLLHQVGHSWYRKVFGLHFFRVRILVEESKLLNEARSMTAFEHLKIETQAIDRHHGWIVNEMVASGRCGLNYWNPFTKKLHMRWGVSLSHLRSIIDEDDFRGKNWTVAEVFERTMKPRAGNMSYIEYLQKTQPFHINEEADWFLNPGCYNCVWFKVVFGGGIPVYAAEPKPVIKGNRYVFAELFLR